MSERYSTVTREALQQCTKEWAETPTDPTDAYLQFSQRIGDVATTYSTYFSTAVTSAGFNRDKTLSKREVIQKNSKIGLEYADTLHDEGLVDIHQSVDAVALGYVPWTQSDYLEFWFHVMARPDFHNPADLQHYRDRKTTATGVNFATFNDSSQPLEVRRPEYLAYADQYLETIDHAETRPIDRAVQLIDRKLSVGGHAEARLAHRLGAKVCAPAVISHITDPSAYPWKDYWLAQHLNELSSLGATTLEPAKQRLVLFEEPSPVQ